MGAEQPKVAPRVSTRGGYSGGATLTNNPVRK